MAEVGVAFLSAFLGVLFDKMTSREVVDFMQRKKLNEGLLRKLKTAVLSVNAVLEDAEEKQFTKPFVKDWVDELKDVLYDAEDILDEIATQALQSKLDAEFRTTTGKVRNSISIFLNPFVNKVEQKTKEILDRLDDLAKRKDFMGLQVGVGGKQYPERSTTSHVKESDTLGRDDDKKKVIDMLLSSDAERNEMCSVIAIVGMGGIGKTTLAQLVYNENEVKQHFYPKIWFCVSEEFDKIKIMKSIIGAANVSPRDIDNQEQLEVKLREILNGKKFLLVLDDVWSEKPIHREFLEQLLQYGTRGSKILVTTRNVNVASTMHATKPHHLNQLPKDDCWSLFVKHAFPDGSSEADPKNEIGKKIVNKCKGLPLAIKAIGDLLWSESDVERWKNILDSDLWNVSLEQTDILPALRLSYKYLPSYLKRCFAYCSIFPKDYVFGKNQLVLLWMAEGFLRQSKKESMEEVGNRYFHALVSRSLFQRSSETNSGFVMHDLVNDLANFVSGPFGFTLEGDSSKEIGNMTRYLSFIIFYNSKNIEKDLYKAKKLRTFLALDSTRFRSSKIKMPRTWWCLRTLCISGVKGISKWLDSISIMKHLRYLDVSFTFIGRLPNSLCMLCNLQTLKLSGCWNLERFPRDMWKLSNLRHLEIDETEKLKEMPVKMDRLRCLQTLTKFIVSKNNRSGIGKLGKLMNLRGKLLILELQNVRSVEDSLDAILKDKVYLEELVLEWNHPKGFGISESHERSVLENLQPHENLKSLTIKYYGGKGFPDWIGGLPSLSMLVLTKCKYCTALPPLGQLPFLTELYIDGLDRVVTVGPEFYGNGLSLMKPFRRLKFLKLKNMSSWENWFHLGAENEVETFSQLEELYIEQCPDLRGKLPVHLPSLSKLEISFCKHLEGSLPVELFPKLTHMSIGWCQNLESLALAEQLEHGRTTDFNCCLEELHVFQCSSLVSLPRDGLFSTLKRLEIWYCKKLELPTHRQYSSLDKLSLKNCCDSLTSFPLDIFPNMKEIEINGCWNLQSLEQHGGDLVISSIAIWNCPSLVSFSKGGLHSPNLVDFVVHGCERLRSMRDKMHLFLPSLRYLLISNCPEVEPFPEGGLPSNLKEIEITECKRLLANWRELGLERLPSLELLKIGGGNVESFPGQLLLPTTLTRLGIYSFSNLKSLEGFQHLISLVHLKIKNCPKLKYMPEEGFPVSLHFLRIDSCPVLEKEVTRREGKEWLKVARVPNVWINYIRIQGKEWPPREYLLERTSNSLQFSSRKEYLTNTSSTETPHLQTASWKINERSKESKIEWWKRAK